VAARGLDPQDPFAQAEIRAAPPQVGKRNGARVNVKSGPSNHIEVFLRVSLDIHWMTEQKPDDPGMDVSARGFGDQQQSTRLENAMKFTQRFALRYEVMKGLVAK